MNIAVTLPPTPDPFRIACVDGVRRARTATGLNPPIAAFQIVDRGRSTAILHGLCKVQAAPADYAALSTPGTLVTYDGPSGMLKPATDGSFVIGYVLAGPDPRGLFEIYFKGAV
jgi:hypothetical protein